MAKIGLKDMKQIKNNVINIEFTEQKKWKSRRGKDTTHFAKMDQVILFVMIIARIKLNKIVCCRAKQLRTIFCCITLTDRFHCFNGL